MILLGSHASRRVDMCADRFVAKTSRGVDLLDQDTHLNSSPYCPHGPTLLFERFYAAGKPPRQFYACAVHRSRKGCSFFYWKDEPVSKDKRDLLFGRFQEAQARDRENLTKGKAEKLKNALKTGYNAFFCVDCSELLSSEEAAQHATDHLIRRDIGEWELSHPSQLLFPHSDKKSKAQYFFSEETITFLVSELQRLGYTQFLSLGTPTLHEALSATGQCSCFLLDIDLRYSQFYSPAFFQQFNMFNAFFYSGNKGEKHTKKFLQPIPSGKTVLLVDPPFGGLVKAFSSGIRKIWSLAGTDLHTLLFFPYFCEGHVLESVPSFTMLDYQVVYSNHKNYSKSSQAGLQSKPSPVRIFTNIPLPALQLPAEEGYWFCSKCNRYVCEQNKHCEKCDACASKDGRAYVHCDQCGTCVKAGRTHCSSCGRCEPLQHSCETRPQVGCHVCGALDHKRRDCPEKQLRKRPLSTHLPHNKTKRKKK